MASILFRFQDFLRRFSRRLFLLFNRQEIFLVDESGFIKLFEDSVKNNPDIAFCYYCEKKLDAKNVQGYFFDDKNIIHFFCADTNHDKKPPKEG